MFFLILFLVFRFTNNSDFISDKGIVGFIGFGSGGSGFYRSVRFGLRYMNAIVIDRKHSHDAFGGSV